MASVKVKQTVGTLTAHDEIEVDYRPRHGIHASPIQHPGATVVNHIPIHLSMPILARDLRVSSLQDINYFTLFRDDHEKCDFSSKDNATRIGEGCLEARRYVLGRITDYEDIISCKEDGSLQPCDPLRLQLVLLDWTNPSKAWLCLISGGLSLISSGRRDIKSCHMPRLVSTFIRGIDARPTTWIANEDARVNDIVVRVQGSLCPLLLRQRPSRDLGYHFVCGARHLLAGSHLAGGTQMVPLVSQLNLSRAISTFVVTLVGTFAGRTSSGVTGQLSIDLRYTRIEEFSY